MRIQFQQLAGNLKDALAPVYLLCGDEPLQLGDAARAVRAAARARGFEERELLEQEGNFDWGSLAVAAASLSLFCSRKLIELRLHTGRIGHEGSDALRAYCRDISSDNLLMVLAPELERKELQARWVQEIDRLGVVLQVRQIEGPHLVAWIEQRLGERGLRPEPGVAALLAEHVVGNLPAAAQEVEKLRLLYDGGALDRAQLLGAISDSARYDLYDLTDAALAGDRAGAHRIVAGLAAEGTPATLVLWVLARELRLLASVSHTASRRGTDAALRAHRVWESRRTRVSSALQRLSTGQLRDLAIRCEAADRQIKGLMAGDPWRELAAIADELAGGAACSPPSGLPSRQIC